MRKFIVFIILVCLFNYTFSLPFSTYSQDISQKYQILESAIHQKPISDKLLPRDLSFLYDEYPSEFSTDYLDFERLFFNWSL